jgi:dTDP-4-amino-4,6-dideoxygalactose transaminase
MINIFQPSLGNEELARISDVFRSNWLGKGNVVLDFEKGFAASLRADPSLFTSTTCCTEGLFLAMELFHVGAEHEVIIPSCSFVAVGSAVLAAGAKMVFCDVDPRSMNVSAANIAAKLTERTKAVYVTHYGGVPCDMDPIIELCRPRKIAIIEDAACAVRSFYKGRACGTLGDMGVWSFDAMKIICTGDGGMIYLRAPKLMEAAKESLYLGLPNKQKSGMDNSATGTPTWWEYQINRPGRRAVMNNVAGAIGLSQLEKLPGFLARRRAIHDRYDRELSGLKWLALPPPLPSDCESSYYFYWIGLERRDALAKYLLDQGVYTTFRYWPLHRVDYFLDRAARLDDTGLPGAEHASRNVLNIPLHQALTDDDVTRIIDLVRRFPG